MKPSNPFAAWLAEFLGAEPARLLHVGRSPRRLRPLIMERRWRRAYPFSVLGRTGTAAIREMSREANVLQLAPWLISPDVRLVLSSAVVDYLVKHIPLAPADLNLPVMAARRLGVPAPTEIGLIAPRVAYLLYALSSLGAPLRRFRWSEARIIDQLEMSIARRIAMATPADLIAIHVMMRRLMALKSEIWAQTALEICLPFSPLTYLLEDADEISKIAPYDWSGIEVALSAFGLDGLQIRCAQALVDTTIPGWDWHTTEEPIRHARFRRAAELFRRLALALDDADFGAVRAMRLATWILRAYKLIGQVLEVYQRVLLPPPLDPKEPAFTPSFRMLQPLLPTSAEAIRDQYAGLVAPIPALMSLLVEASQITSTPVFIPDGLPQSPRAEPYPYSDDLNIVAGQLLEMWNLVGPRYGALLGNLYAWSEAVDLTS